VKSEGHIHEGARKYFLKRKEAKEAKALPQKPQMTQEGLARRRGDFYLRRVKEEEAGIWNREWEAEV